MAFCITDFKLFTVCSVSDDRPQASDVPPGFHDKSQAPAEPSSVARAATAAAQENGSAPSASAAIPQDVEKQLRNLRKKIRQAEGTVKKAKEGKQLSPEEQEKLRRLATW